MADDDIKITGEFENNISRPADAAARSIDHLGDEARETAAELAMAEAAAAAATDQTNKLSTATTKNTRVTEKNTKSKKKNKKETREVVKEYTRFQKIVRGSMRGMGAGIYGLGRGLGGIVKGAALAREGLGKIFGPAMMITKLGSMVELVGVLAVGLKAVGAGAIVAANGLLPLVGLAAALPAGMGALFQAKGMFKMATAGMKNGKNLSAEGKKFVDTLKKIKPEAEKVQKSIQGKLFAGLSEELKPLSEKYLPLVDKYLGNTATNVNHVAKGFSGWLQSKDGVRTMTKFMSNNAAVVGMGAQGLTNLAKIMIRVSTLAGPMMKNMLADVNVQLGKADKWLKNNGKSVRKYFIGSWERAKGIMGVVKNVGLGLGQVFKAATPYTDKMGDSIATAATKFKDWAASAKGQKSIKGFFKNMMPIFDEAVGLAGDLGKMLLGIGSSGETLDLLKRIRKDGVPTIEKILKAVTGKFLPAVLDMALAIGDLVDSGFIDTLSQVLSQVAGAITAFSGWFSKQPDLVKKAVIGLIAALTIFGGLLGRIAGIISSFGTLIGGLGGGGGKGKKGKGGGGLFGGWGGGGGKGKGGKSGKGGGGGFFSGGGGKGKGKGGGKGGGSKPAKPAKPAKNKGGSKPAKPGKAAGLGGGAASGALLGIFAGGAISDAVGGTSKAMSDMEFRAGGAFASMSQGAKSTDDAMNGLFNDMGNPNWNSFGESLQKTANPTKWQSFRQGVQNVAGAVTGATTPLEVAQAKFEGMDTALTQMPAADAAKNFSKIRTEAVQMGVPMEKLTNLFPQYRDSVAGTATATQNAAGGMLNATVAADVMSGVVGNSRAGLQDIASLRVNPTINATDNATPKVNKVDSGIINLNGLTANPTMTARDQATPKINTAQSGLGKLNGTTANPNIDTKSDVPGTVNTATGLLNGLDGKTATTYIVTKKTTINSTQAGAHGPGGSHAALSYLGNDLGAGQLSWVGERGPEFALTRSGHLSLLGGNGPELFNPSVRTAIIPNSATMNPFGGDYGNAPGWAKEALQRAYGADGEQSLGGLGSRSYNGDGGGHYDQRTTLTIQNLEVGSVEDVGELERTLRRMLRKIERDKKRNS